MEYTAKAIRFKSTLDRLLLDQFTEAMDGVMDFYQNAIDVYKGLKPRVDELKTSLSEQLVAWEQRLASLEDERFEFEKVCSLIYIKPLIFVIRRHLNPRNRARHYLCRSQMFKISLCRKRLFRLKSKATCSREVWLNRPSSFRLGPADIATLKMEGLVIRR